MGLDRAEFLRSLGRAVAGLPWRQEGPHIQVEDPPRRVEIQLGQEQQRRLGALIMPELEVTIRFQGYSVRERDLFLRRFDLAYRRGGG